MNAEILSFVDAPVPHQMPSFAQSDMLAGNAVFTVVSKVTGQRFTYKVRAHEFEDKSVVHFVSVLAGADNETSYSYMGMIKNGQFKSTKNSKVSQNAKSFLAFTWLFQTLFQTTKDPLAKVEIFHSGHCLCCGRLLTVPESIETGYGPVCAEKLGIAQVVMSVATVVASEPEPVEAENIQEPVEEPAEEAVVAPVAPVAYQVSVDEGLVIAGAPVGWHFFQMASGIMVERPDGRRICRQTGLTKFYPTVGAALSAAKKRAK